jgi:tryptophanyl-tRNA synthetase
VIAQLVPIQERYATLVADPAELDRLLAVGADKAEAIAAPVLHRATTAMGLGRG